MQIDYPYILKTYYPNKVWSGSGATYDRIVWTDGTPIPKAELDTFLPKAALAKAKETAYNVLTTGYTEAANAGFPSSALGTPHIYPSSPDNQIDIIGTTLICVVSPTTNVPFPCFDVTAGKQGQKLHTSSQWTQVFMDGVIYKQTLFAAYEKQTTALDTMTQAQLEAVTFVKPV